MNDDTAGVLAVIIFLIVFGLTMLGLLYLRGY